MTITCIVCKKEPVPFDYSRSFHKFPKNNDLKTKWMNAIGKFSIKKNSKVCSDHFDTGSYHDTNGYTTLRRLLPTAVPRIRSSNELLLDVPNKFIERRDKTVPKYFQSIKSHNIKIIEENEISNSEENTRVGEYIINVDNANFIGQSTGDNSNNKSDNSKAGCHFLTIEPLKTTGHTPYNDLNISSDEIIKQHHNQNDCGHSNNLKRIDYAVIKKICHRGKFKKYCFTREKFSSDEAWEEFQEFSTFIKHKVAAAVKRRSLQQQKITSLKMKCAKYLSTNSQARHLKGVHGIKKTCKQKHKSIGANIPEMPVDDAKPEIHIDNLHEMRQNVDSEEDYMNCVDVEIAAPIVQLTEYENLNIVVNNSN